MAHCDILLIQPPHERRPGSGNTLPLGLGYLASYLASQKNEVQIIDCTTQINSVSDNQLTSYEKFFLNNLKEKTPKYAIGIGPCMTSSARGTLAIAQLCKKFLPNIPLFFGGPLASTEGQEWFFFDHLNAEGIIKGDGEIPLSKCLLKIKNEEKIENIEGVMTDVHEDTNLYCIENLDSLPFPARHLFPQDSYKLSIRRDLFEYPFTTIVGTRGCPNRCPFCVTGSLKEGTYRKRTFENIGMEISYLSKKDNIKQIVFYDDQLFSNSSSVNIDMLNFCEMMQKYGRGIMWQIELRPDIALNIEDETIVNLYNSFCRQINFGIEKGYKKGMHLFGKKCSPEEVSELFNRIHRINSKMRLAATFILGGEGETDALIEETINFSQQLNLLFCHYNPLELYPGTQFYQETFGEKSRKWYDLIFNVDNLSCEVIFENANMPKERLYEFINVAYKSFYQRKNWLKLAKHQLSNKFDIIFPSIETWKYNRLKGFPKK